MATLLLRFATFVFPPKWDLGATAVDRQLANWGLPADG
jgi:hypothetical protein